jgi:hypothetical protein
MGDAMKACPACAEQIQAAAKICRFCKYDFRTGAGSPPPLPPRKSGGLGIVAIVVIVVLVGGGMLLAIVAAIAIPGLLSAQRASNERNASATLKTICTAESDYRSNDRDNDRAQNFWVRDVYGLFALNPSLDGQSMPPSPTMDFAIKLIEPSCAGADGGGLGVAPGCAPLGGYVGIQSPKANYVFIAFESYERGGGGKVPFGAEGTIKGWGKCFNFSKYAFMAAPINASAGRSIFAVNEDCTIWRIPVGSGYSASYSPGKLSWSGGPIAPGEAYPQSPGSSGWSKIY